MTNMNSVYRQSISRGLHQYMQYHLLSYVFIRIIDMCIYIWYIYIYTRYSCY